MYIPLDYESDDWYLSQALLDESNRYDEIDDDYYHKIWLKENEVSDE